MSLSIRCEIDHGKGRALVLLREEQTFPHLASLCDGEEFSGRVVSFLSPPVTSTSWEILSQSFAEQCEELNIRQGLFVACGDAANVLMHLALHEPRRVRQMVLLDATTSPHPNLKERVVSRLEKHLPMGLPFKGQQQGFDARSFLQRIRCPVLVLSSDTASSYLKEEAGILVDTLPTAWHLSIDHTREGAVADLIREFQEVPARCPQKNLSRVSAS